MTQDILKKIDHILFPNNTGEVYVIHYNYISLAIVDNPYFRNLINFLLYKFDKPEYVNTVLVIIVDYQNAIPELRKKYPEKKIIAYCWEQLCSSNNWMNVEYICKGIKLADEIWHYNRLNAKYMQAYHGVKDYKIYPFEYYPEIEILNNKENPEIDVLFYGFFNERRSDVISKIHKSMYNKFNIVILLGSTVDTVYKYIEDSKVVLNIHGFEYHNRQEQERIGFLLGNKKCVVSEISHENYFSNAIIETPLEYLCNTLFYMLQENRWNTQGKLGYNIFKNGLQNRVINER